MKCAFLLVLPLAVAAVNPVSKVLQLLSSLEGKLRKDGEAEVKAFKEYETWCKDGAKDLGFEIKTSKSDIEDLTATIGKADADISESTTKIEELAGDTVKNEADLKAATVVRTQEKKEYVAAEAELTDAIYTLDRAINVLEKKLRGSALMQTTIDSNEVSEIVRTIGAIVDAASLSLHDKQQLISLAQNSQSEGDAADDEDVGAPAPEAYKSHRKSIVEVLEDMRAKAASQLGKLQNEEVTAKHNFELLRQSLEDQMAADAKEIDQSKSTKSEGQGTKATAEGELAETKEKLAADEKTLSTMGVSCKTAVEQHEASVKSRAEELKALVEAQKVISENVGAAESKVYSFLQVRDSHQISTRVDLVNVEVVNLLRQLARKDESAALSQLASRVSAAVRFGTRGGADPFVKVKELIKSMLDKLTKDGEAEATHKAWCDEQMGDTEQKTMELKHDIEGLTAKIDKAKARSTKLKDEARDTQAALAQLASSQAELDKVRKEENMVFIQTKADLEAGLKGVRMALKILKDYYASSALVQQPALEPGHSKAAGAGTSIIGMLEVIASDFGKSLATAEAEDDVSATDYERVSMTNRLNKAQWERDVTYKTKEYTSLDKSLSELSSDRDSAQTELDAVLEYTKSVRGACEIKPETFDERKGRREDEIAGLKEALQILEGESVFLEKSSVLRLRHRHSQIHA